MIILMASCSNEVLNLWLINSNEQKIIAKVHSSNILDKKVVFELIYKNKKVKYEVLNEKAGNILATSVNLLIKNNIISSIKDADRVIFTRNKIKFEGAPSEILALEKHIRENEINYEELFKY